MNEQELQTPDNLAAVESREVLGNLMTILHTAEELVSQQGPTEKSHQTKDYSQQVTVGDKAYTLTISGLTSIAKPQPRAEYLYEKKVEVSIADNDTTVHKVAVVKYPTKWEVGYQGKDDPSWRNNPDTKQAIFDLITAQQIPELPEVVEILKTALQQVQDAEAPVTVAAA